MKHLRTQPSEPRVRKRPVRRRTQEQLAQGPTELQQMFENLDDVLLSVDTAHGKLLQLSPSCERLSGWAPGVFFKNIDFWKDIVFDRDRWMISRIQADLSEGNPASYECRILDRNGFVRWIEARLKPAFDVRGSVVRVDGVLTDITGRKQADEALRQSEEKYRRLFEESKDAIFISSPDGRFLDINPAGVELLGYASKDEVLAIGNVQELYLDPEKRSDFRSIIERQGYIRDFEIVVRRRDDRMITVLETATAMINDKGAVLAYRGIWRDVTEQRRIEAQFLRAQRIESIGMLASGIAHDLNNIFAPILMAAQLLKLRAQNDRDHRTLDMLEVSAIRGADLVKQILTFARGVEGERGPMQLRHMIRDVVKIMTETFPKSIRIVSDTSTDLWAVYGDSTQLHQVLMNLCVNARDAMGAGGLLKLSARNVMQTEEQEHDGFKSRPGAYVVLEVSDTGEGIPPEMLHKIFDAFFTTKDPDKGTGLGLSTVQTVVRNHAGFVNVESTLGSGTTFMVYLPALRSSIETRGKRVAPLPPGNGELLLIVDDEAAIRDVARATLETYGYRVLLAADGEEALKTFLQCRNDIKVVLSDVNMPGMGGEQLGRTIELLHPGMAVIFMSGVAPGPGLSARPFIQKPFTAQRLLTVLRDALHGQNAFS